MMQAALLLLELIVAACLLQTRRGVCQDLPVFDLHPQGSIQKSGDTVVLNCATDSLSDVIQWKLNGTNVAVGAASGTLTIASVGDASQGYYYCVAMRTTQNGLFTVSSAEAHIRLAFLSSPYDDAMITVSVDSGDSLILECIPMVTSLPDPRYTWYREFSSGHTAPGLSTANSAVDGPNGKAILRRVDQSLTYVCELDNVLLGSNVQYTTKVTVFGNELPDSDPVMLVPPEDALVNLGDTLYLYCITTDTKAVTWSLNGVELTLGTGGNVDILIPGETTTLLIQQVNQSSAGVYTCGHPDLGKYNATVSIRDPPEIVNPPGTAMTVNYGDQFSLSCMVEGTVLKYNWYLNGTQLSDNTNVLLRDSATYASAGTYQCYAYNEAGNDSFATFISVFAEAPAIVTAPPPKLVGFLGRSLNISCEASGIPPPAYYWSANGDPFEKVVGGTLSIDVLTSSDSGKYICEATNDIGPSATASTEVLLVEPTTVHVAPTYVVVHLGQNFSLRCNETHDDLTSVEITWFFGDVLVESAGRRSLIKEEGSVELQISDAKDEDAGEYSCRETTTLTNYTIGSPLAGEAVSLVTVTPSPVRPVVTVFEALNSTAVMVSWTYAGVTENLENFVIEIKRPSNAIVAMEMVEPGAETRLTVTGLVAYTEYVVLVGAVEKGGQVYYSDSMPTPSVTTSEALPAAPTGVSAEALEDGTSISASWEALEPPHSNGLITKYTVRYFQTNLTDVYAQLNLSDALPFASVGGNVTSYTISSLTPETEYTIDVAAHTSVGMGPFSEPVSVTTQSLKGATLVPLWFIVLMAVIAVLLLMIIVLVFAIAYWKRTKAVRYPVSHSKSSCDTSEPMTEDAILDYENRKKDIVTLTTFDGADSEIDGSAVTLPTTISSLGPSHYRMNVVSPPSYINPPSFEETLRAKSISMSVIERPPDHVRFGSGWSMGHEKQNHSDARLLDMQAVLGAESGSSEDSGVTSQTHTIPVSNCTSYV